MNYLTELLAFYKWLETARLSPLLQAYWYLLMYYNNKAAVLGKVCGTGLCALMYPTPR